MYSICDLLVFKIFYVLKYSFVERVLRMALSGRSPIWKTSDGIGLLQDNSHCFDEWFVVIQFPNANVFGFGFVPSPTK